MNGVSRKRPAEVAEPPESEVFKKCYICRARPASIRCGDCLREHRAELMCYGCSRKVHSEKLHHAYEYATFKDMLLQEEEKSFQDTDSFPTNSLMKMEGRSSKLFYDDDNDRMTQDASFISAVDAFAHQNDSPTKRQYQTFGRRSDQFSPQNKFGNSPTKSVQNASEPEDKENRPRDRHGNERHERLLREASRSRLLSGSSKPRVLEEAANSNQGKSHHHSISTNTSSNNQKAVEERTPIRDNDERRQRLPPRNERAILREVAVNNQTEKPVSRPEQDNSESKYTRTSRPINNSRSYDRAAAAREFEESSPVKVTDQNKLPQDSSRGYTPTKSVSKQGTEHRLLSGSNWKSKSKATDNHPQLMHSPAYIDSITELHKTEIESMKTKHRVEIDRLESELCSMSKTYESELKMLKDGAKEAYEELTELHIKNEELEKVVHNLKTQNSLLKEENELLRKSTFENSSKENNLMDEMKRMQRSFENEQQALKSKCLKEMDCVRQEYEEHFVEQITMYTENIRNKDNIIRCKDEMIHNLEREVERLRKMLEVPH